MRKKRFKLFLSIFIVLSLTFAFMIGLASITWADVPQSRILEVSTWDELITGLTESDALEVKLMKDLEERYEFPLEQKTVSPEDAKKFFVINKRVNIDLNGHKLELINNTSYKNYAINNMKRPVYMFTIKDGGGLLIKDSDPKEKGEIRHHATLRDEKKSYWFHEANVFKVEKGGGLAIDGGNIYAGRESRTWISAAPKDTQEHLLDMLYTGYGYNMTGGTCITNEGGKAVVNGGKLTSFRSWKAPDDAGDVILHKGGRTILNAGTLDATGFAQVFNDKLKNKSLTIEGPLKITTTSRWIHERGYAYRSRYGGSKHWNIDYIKLDYGLMTNEDGFTIDGKYYHNLYWTWKGEPMKSVLPDTKEDIEKLLKLAKNMEFLNDSVDFSFELGNNDKSELEFFIAEGETLDTKVFGKLMKFGMDKDRDIGLGRKPVFEVYSSYPGEEEFTVYHPKVFDDNHFRIKGEEKANGTHLIKVVEVLGGKPAGQMTRKVKINVTKDKIQPDLRLITEDTFLTVDEPFTITREVPNLADMPADGVYVEKTEWKYKGPTTNIITIDTKTNNDSTVDIPGHSEPGSYFYYCTVTASNQTKKTEIISFIVSPKGSVSAKPIIDIKDKVELEYGVPIRINIGSKGGKVTSWKFDHNELPSGFVAYIDSQTKEIVIGGTPTRSLRKYMTITAKNNMGEDTKKVEFIVKSPYVITTKEFTVEKYKNTKIQLESSYPKNKNYKELWGIESGSLPTGLTLNEKTGEITGIPTSIGRDYDITFRVIPPPEYAPISGNVTIKVNAKTEFRKDKGNVLEGTFPLGYNGYLFNNLLLEGSDDTKIDIISSPFPCSIDDSLTNWHLKGKVPDKEGTYEFDLKATNKSGSDSVKVRVITKEIATLKGDGKLAVQALLFAGKGKEYDSENALPGYVNFPAKGDFEWSIEHSKGLSMDDFAKEYGLTFDKTTGKFTGKPLKTTGKNEDGSPKGEYFRIRVLDKNSSYGTESIHTLLHIVEPGEIKAPTKISFEDGTKSKTIGRNTHNDIVIKIDGLPTPNISFTGNGAPPPGTEIIQPGMVFPMPVLRVETDFLGTYNFEIKAENSEGSTTAKLELVVENPKRANTPVIKPAPGEYSKSDLPFELSFEKEKESYKNAILYRINDGDLTLYNYQPGEIKIKEDSIITAYVLALSERMDSEVVSFKYTFADGPSQMAVAGKEIDIKDDKLPDGEDGKKYKDYQMNGTVDGKKRSDIKWIANGLPFGMNISEDGVISGTPHVKGAFTVIIKAYANDGSYGEKQISLQINETKLPFAKKPEITKQPEKVINYKEDSPADVALKALAVEGKTSDGGKITYAWYESTDNKNDTFDDDKVVGQGQYYTPDIKVKGTKYYYALVANSKENHAEAIAFSNVSTINVLFNAEDPKFDGMEDREYTMTEKTVQYITETADTDDNGEISYTWYQMTGDKPNPAKDKEVSSEHSGKGVLEITVPSLGAEGKYYSVATNTNSNATGGKTSNPAIGPTHVITPTDKVAYKITFEVEKEVKSVMQTDFDGKLEVLGSLAGEGYTLEGWYLDKEYKTKLTTDTVFTKDTTVYGKLGEPAELPDVPSDLPFTDVKESDWFYDNVSYVYKSGLMNGTSPTTFGPGGNTTRAMIVTILHRMEGTPNVKGKNPFNDVPNGQYYTDAVIWAEENKIVSGYGEGKFGPNDPITREQMAVILMNYGKFKKYDVTAKGDLVKFADGSKISTWAKDALSWANAKGLIQGSGDNVMPKGQAQRSQVAAILERFIEGYK